MIESRDCITGEHVGRTSVYVKMLLNAMILNGIYINEIVEWNIDTVASSARLHDIGKIAIPDEVFNKPDNLTVEEFNIIKTHTGHGVRIIKQFMNRTRDIESLQHAKLFAENHHEKWDGTGYPQGLAELSIPLHGRIIAIVDVYDALTSFRPYKKSMSHDEAITIIKDGRGKHFEPQIVDIFLGIQDQLQNHLNIS